MEGALKRGERIEIRGFGSFELRSYRPYEGRNPRTGVRVSVQPKRLPFFKVCKELKERVNAGRRGRLPGPREGLVGRPGTGTAPAARRPRRPGTLHRPRPGGCCHQREAAPPRGTSLPRDSPGTALNASKSVLPRFRDGIEVAARRDEGAYP